jgi:hypothetical protein
MVSRQHDRKSGQQRNNHDPQMLGVISAANRMLHRIFGISSFGLRDGITTVRHVASSEGKFRLPETVLRSDRRRVISDAPPLARPGGPTRRNVNAQR